MSVSPKRVRPPIAVEVVDLLNLGRLVLNRGEPDGLFWYFTVDGEKVLGSLFLVPYWRGNLPLFCYTRLPQDAEPKAFLAYRSIGQEECYFTNAGDDPRFVYGAVMEIEAPPEFLLKSLKNRAVQRDIKPVMTRAKDMTVLVRTLLIISEDSASPPIWSFKHNGHSILGVIAPVFDYYDANALPVFLYVETQEEPRAGFLRYFTEQGREVTAFVDSIGEMKYFYARIVRLSHMPLWSAPSAAHVRKLYKTSRHRGV
ncbi:MAG: hypothetical protein RMJ28_01170 [Nitrososphaerota archaeon]|nr:hypothetical protein [Candidatus Calditenuaceae archaeon]MDW8072839.1 hypothetical protein [Nitrososphaerota archaeon]